jgi:digeranylgeranylglycerophospholipid reductase
VKDYDVVVVGGGPAGSMAALTAAELGLSALLIERDNDIGNPLRCAEGVDHKGINDFFTPDPAWISSEISGYSLVAPDGTIVEMNICGNRGYILERLIFDRMIAGKAASAGAKVLTGTDAVGLSEFDTNARSVSLKSMGQEWKVKGKVIIAADGVESRVARWAGLKTHAVPHDMESCAQVLLAGIEVNQHDFMLYFTREFAPGGYAWVFPKGASKANVGIGISGDFVNGKSPWKYLSAFLNHYFPGASIVGRTFGGVPCTGGIEKVYTDGVMVAGDAAHMANPISGGGILNAMIAGKYAAETAYKALKKGSTRESALKEYAGLCGSRFGKMNRRFYLLKEGIFTIPDDRMNEIAQEIVHLPKEKRTPVRVLKSALFNQPDLLYILAKVVF